MLSLRRFPTLRRPCQNSQVICQNQRLHVHAGLVVGLLVSICKCHARCCASHGVSLSSAPPIRLHAPGSKRNRAQIHRRCHTPHELNRSNQVGHDGSKRGEWHAGRGGLTPSRNVDLSKHQRARHHLLTQRHTERAVSLAYIRGQVSSPPFGATGQLLIAAMHQRTSL
jgi:hypothetical protein